MDLTAFTQLISYIGVGGAVAVYFYFQIEKNKKQRDEELRKDWEEHKTDWRVEKQELKDSISKIETKNDNEKKELLESNKILAKTLAENTKVMKQNANTLEKMNQRLDGVDFKLAEIDMKLNK